MYQTYYSAETQDIPLTVFTNLREEGGSYTITQYTFSIKVVSDVYISKSTQFANTSVIDSGAGGSLNYKLIMVTLGRGGAIIEDPFDYVGSQIPSNYDKTVPPFILDSILSKTPYVSSVSVSPAGADIEVTTTTSLYLAAGITYIRGSKIEI